MYTILLVCVSGTLEAYARALASTRCRPASNSTKLLTISALPHSHSTQPMMDTRLHWTRCDVKCVCIFCEERKPRRVSTAISKIELSSAEYAVCATHAQYFVCLVPTAERNACRFHSIKFQFALSEQFPTSNGSVIIIIYLSFVISIFSSSISFDRSFPFSSAFVRSFFL